MKVQLKIEGTRGFETVSDVVEKDMEVGSGIRFLLHNTRYSINGEVMEINAEERLVRVKSPQFHDWIGFDAIRDIVSRDTISNDSLQAQIDHGITED